MTTPQTTSTELTPAFTTTHGHPAVRAVVILGLCAALVGGFIASSVRGPATANVSPDTVACDATAHSHHAC